MDFIIVPLILFIGYIIAKNHNLKSKVLGKIAMPLYFYHIIFSIFFYLYISNKGGDALGYWRIAKESDLSLLFLKIQTKLHASDVIYVINYFPSKILDLSFFTGNIIYGVFGYIGLLYMLRTIENSFPYIDGLKNYKILSFNIIPWMFFLPNFHFWSAGIGKDTISFVCICMFMYGILKPFQRWLPIVIAVLLTYLIRPHITLFLFSAYGGALLLLSNLPKYQKFIILIIAFIAFLPLLNYALDFANIQEKSIDSYQNFSKSKADALKQGAGSSVDITALPYPLKVLTFLYRPFFFDAGNLFGLFASIENLIWVILSFKFFTHKPIKVLAASHFIVLGSFLYWLVGAIAFAPVMSNLGIIVRERNMFLPAFFIFIIGSLSKTKDYYIYANRYRNYLLKKKRL